MKPSASQALHVLFVTGAVQLCKAIGWLCVVLIFVLIPFAIVYRRLRHKQPMRKAGQEVIAHFITLVRHVRAF